MRKAVELKVGLNYLLCSNSAQWFFCSCLMKMRQAKHFDLEVRIQEARPQTSQTSFGRAKSPCRTIQANRHCLRRAKINKDDKV